MPLDFDFLNLSYHSDDSSHVLEEYVEYVANKKLLRYKQIIHTGGKAGESLWAHVMNLITVIEKLRPLFNLNVYEMSCLLLALTVHDLNKVDRYGKRPDGKSVRYANAAAKEHIADELVDQDAANFFPVWKEYLFDITYLAHAHQEGSLVETVLNQRELDSCRLDMGRLEGPLKFLMKVADVSDNSHSGDHASWHEKHIRDKFLGHLNAALYEDGQSRRYRFVGHRLAEQRGLLTNILHNDMVTFLRDTYGKEACIDILYHPEGVDYLLDKRIPLTWTESMLQSVAQRIGQHLANIQFDKLAQFIKATPSGIGVDNAAMQSGASLEQVFLIIKNIVERKLYRLEWREQRNIFVRNDLEAALASEKTSKEVKEHITQLLRERDLVPTDESMLKRGEFLTAYRNFLKDHCSDQLKVVKQEAWARVYRLFHLQESSDALYAVIDPFRRGYFVARNLPAKDIDSMMEEALADLTQLEGQVTQALATRKAKKPAQEETEHVLSTLQEVAVTPFDTAYIKDYLERHLEVWDSVTSTSGAVTDTRPVQRINFGETLVRYADPKRQHVQCCYCGSALKADEWMAIQVPPNIGVQSFSNRLEAGSIRDPKRNVCDVCRTQFILEKLAWPSHRDKQGNEQVTFYLHLFPYSYYTQPLLRAWWQSIQRLRDTDHTSLFFETREYFSQWEQQQHLHAGVTPRFYRLGTEGVGIPTLSEAISNTPVLPLIVSGSNYGMQFLLALEKTALLANWFDSRVLLSRMPVPSLNLANEYIDNEPIALMVENAPRSTSWLLPKTACTQKDVNSICRKLSYLHQLADKIAPRDESFEATIYDFVVACSEDPLALHYEVDRLIEQSATRKKGKKPEYQAISLSHVVAPLLEELTRL